MSAVRRPAADQDLQGREAPRARVHVIAAIIGIVALVLAARLVYLQVAQHEQFQREATAEHWRRTPLPPRRGNILDASGNPLVTTVEYASLYASTTEISDPDRVAAALAPILGQGSDELRAKLAKTQSAPTLLQAWLPDDVARQVRKLTLEGLFFQDEPRRSYAEGSLAAQVLGVVGVDDNGLSGLELRYNGDLAGKPGLLVAERDTSGDAIAVGPSLQQNAIDGSTLTLTIDRYVEWVAERELTAAIAAHHAKSGTIIVLDPHTGAVLALASRPSFDPNNSNLYSRENIALYDIPGVANAFGPGSIFQVVTMAAALDAGVVTPDTVFFNSGSFDYAGGTIRDASQRPAGSMSMTQVMVYSSNVGSSWVAARLGATKFYQALRALGIGQPTDVDLPGETVGLVRQPTAADWNPFDVATNSFGQGIAVTPLQLASAMATIANGGAHLKPYVVKKVTGPAGTHLSYPTILGPAIRPETAATLSRMLVAVVDDNGGEGRLARVPGYALAGKTGTAELPEPGGSSKPAMVASFLGFGPAENPRFVILIRIDEPQDTPSGEAIAAPVFGAIARQLLSYYQIPPSRPMAGNGT